MGKWSQKEYDRQLSTKVRRLFESSLGGALIEQPEDPRFRTFVKELDPDNKQIQACFRSLVHQMTYEARRNRDRTSTTRRRFRNPRYLPEPRLADPDDGRSPYHEPLNATNPFPAPMSSFILPFLEDEDDDLGDDFAQREVPYDIGRRAEMTRVVDRLMNPPTDSERRLSPDPIGLTDAADEDAGSLSARRRSLSPPRGTRRSPSPSFSPSRAVLFEERDREAGERRQRAVDDESREPTPPRSPSRAWLEEYSRDRAAAAAGTMDNTFDVLDRLRDRNASLSDSLGRLRRTHSQYLRGEPDAEEIARQTRRIRRMRARSGENEAASAPTYYRTREPIQADRRRDGVVFDDAAIDALAFAEPALVDDDAQPDLDGFRPWRYPGDQLDELDDDGSVLDGPLRQARAQDEDEDENQGMLALDGRGYITVVPRPASGEDAGII